MNMMRKLRFSLFVIFLSLLCPLAGYVLAASLYLAPDTIRIHSGGSEAFQLELRADNSVSGMSLYSVEINIDKTLLAVDSVIEGPLFYTCGATVPFYTRFNADSTVLIIQSLIVWPRCAVNGDGLLATIFLKNIGSGIHVCNVGAVEVRDINNNIIPGVTGNGSILYLNTPPDPFDLISPASGQSFMFVPGDSVTVSWQPALTHYLADSVLYELTVSEEAGFPPAKTHTFINITLTHFKISETVLKEGNNYWKMRAYNTFGFSRNATHTDWYFVMSYYQPPSTFSLLIPRDDSVLNVIGKSLEYFSWNPATSSVPNDTLRYSLYIGRGSTFPGGEDFIINNLQLHETTIDIDSFKLYTQYYWGVKCTNRVGQSSWCSSVFRAKYYLRGDANGDAKINVGDAVFLINHIFKLGPAPALQQMGDANCDKKSQCG